MQWAEACEFLLPGNEVNIRGFFRTADPDGGESQQTMTPSFDYVLRARTSDPSGAVGRHLFCDNCGWVVELRDDNVATTRIDGKAWKKKVREEVARLKSVVNYHKLANVIEAWRSQHGITGAPDGGSSSGSREDGKSGRGKGAGGGGAAAAAAAVESEGVLDLSKGVNFYGIVVDYTHPRKTNGTDWQTSLTVVDETYPDGLKISLFMDLAETSPMVRRVGDILRLHRAGVSEYLGEPQVMRQKGFNFSLFSPAQLPAPDDLVSSVRPYQCCTYLGGNRHNGNLAKSTKTDYKYRDGDGAAVRELAAWSVQYLRGLSVVTESSLPGTNAGKKGKEAAGAAAAAAGGKDGTGVMLRGTRMLKDVTDLNIPFDLFCRLSKLPQQGQVLRFLAQDGSTSPAAPHTSAGLIVHVSSAEHDLLAAIDSMFTVAATSGAATAGAPGIWCKLRDVVLLEQSEGGGGEAGRARGGKEVVGVMKTASDLKSSLVVLPVCHSQVAKLAAALKVKLPKTDAAGPVAGADGKRPADEPQGGSKKAKRSKHADAGTGSSAHGSGSAASVGDAVRGAAAAEQVTVAQMAAAVGGGNALIVTSAGHGGVPMSTVSQVLEKVKSEPLNKFRVLAKVATIEPLQVAACVRWSRLEKKYVAVVRLVLEDATGALTASVSYGDFEEFFGVEQAALLTADGASKCEKGMKTLTVPRAVAQLCLKSWETADGRVRFAVFASKIK